MRIHRRYRPILTSLEPRVALSAIDPTEPVDPPDGSEIGDGDRPVPMPPEFIVMPLPKPIGPGGLP